jgi:3-oxoadipate enol-lactonase
MCCVHGSGGTRSIWKAQRARLEEPVAALDLTGHGDSKDIDVAAGDPARNVYVRDTLAVASAIDADVLVGNSLGGSVILEAVLEHDPDVEAVVLLGSGAKLGVKKTLRRWLAEDWDRAVEFLHEPDRLFHEPSGRLTDLSRQAMAAVGRDVTERDFLTCHHFDVRDRLGEVSVPLLAVTGVYDQLTPPRFHGYLSSGCPQGRAALVPEAAHLSMLERPTPVNRLLTSFVNRHAR